jgi:hypothetical protein
MVLEGGRLGVASPVDPHGSADAAVLIEELLAFLRCADAACAARLAARESSDVHPYAVGGESHPPRHRGALIDRAGWLGADVLPVLGHDDFPGVGSHVLTV